MEKKKSKIKFYNSLAKVLPKNQIIYFVILLFKFIPLFVITHDWNISSKKGISYWIRKNNFIRIHIIFNSF